MFPVPSHLPRTGEEPTISPKNEEVDSKVEVDTVLELFEPLFRGGELDSKTVRGVRESVQAAIVKNKVSYSTLLQRLRAEVTEHIPRYPQSQLPIHLKSYQKRLPDNVRL
jgi:hypothetical protein